LQMTATTRSPWWWVPTMYFQQGLPVILIQSFSVLMYKKMGVSNEQNTLWTSLLAWPWIIKMFWGPVVDAYSTKLRWVQITQVLITIGLGLTAVVIGTEHFFPASLILFFITAILSATHDNALDAYYIVSLSPSNQAFFMGLTSTFFRLAMIFCSGTLVVLAGVLEEKGLSIPRAWQLAVFLATAIYAVLVIYGRWAAPVVPQDVKVESKNSFVDSFKTFFGQEHVVPILLFILLYRFGESMLTKMSGLFLMDAREAGGLGLTTIQVGLIIGNIGMIALVAGGVLGGMVVSKYGVKRCIWPMAFFMHFPTLFYLWAAHTQPGAFAVSFIVAVEYFAYGFGLASYMVFGMYVAQKSKFKASHYAIATGVMALGAMFSGITSGIVQKAFGYQGLFLAVCLATIPGMLLIFFLPLDPPKRGETV
jgi:PAT family beta-lactamase induction signal transducer AmpG